MPRQARLDAPCVLQHIMARGIERRKIFWDDKDRASFLERLAIILEETQTQCYAWALIPNHFHLLLRTGPISLSTVMRRLMTGYAVTFNIRHKRSGHLFQNRYKSVICEEDAYLLELTRYIHLNPLRAGLVEDLNALDKYPWSGHSVLMGKLQNPLIPKLEKEVSSADKRIAFSQFRPETVKTKINPANPVNPVKKEKSLAEKTIDEVLCHFGSALNNARQHYRAFVEKGIKQGRRPELQGGGLVRSSGGDKAGLLGLKKENREKSDQRILGSGSFVSTTLQQSERILEKKYKPKQTIDDLIAVVADKVGISPELICSRSRQRKPSEARAIFSYLAVEETGYPAADVARFLGVKRMSVHEAVIRGKTLCAEYALLGAET
ncbi:MAG TPA: transposase [Anaerolineae bacterium]|nr:transposase [Anaerolineae bacterium]